REIGQSIFLRKTASPPPNLGGALIPCTPSCKNYRFCGDFSFFHHNMVVFPIEKKRSTKKAHIDRIPVNMSLISIFLPPQKRSFCKRGARGIIPLVGV
ncbi:MAG: hypothetical protein IKB91_03975, partial [Anaerotignum sp.]|nr:hypothetical protein [Anaerotignum sp.]